MGDLDSLIAIIATLITAISLTATTLSETYKFHTLRQTDELRFNYIMISKKTKQMDAVIRSIILCIIIIFLSSFITIWFSNFGGVFWVLYLLSTIALTTYEILINNQRNKKILTIECDDGTWYLHTQTNDNKYLFKKVKGKNLSESIGEMKLLKTEDMLKYYNGFVSKKCCC